MGSFRGELVRDNKVIEVIDLYDTFIFGKSSFNKRLRSGDIVFVKPVQNLVSVIGGVKRPFVYELKETDTLDRNLFCEWLECWCGYKWHKLI